MKEYLYLIDLYASLFLLDSKLVKAVIQAESDWRTHAVRYEKSYVYLYKVDELAKKHSVTSGTLEMLQKSSWGLMQVMGAVAMEYGLNELPSALVRPEVGIYFGCLHLESMKHKWGNDPFDIYAAYNAGAVRKDNQGEYRNKSAMDRFRKIYNKLQ